MNLEKPLAVLFWMIVAFCFGWWCALHPLQAFQWAGATGDYIASVINHDCKPPSGFKCVPDPSPSPTAAITLFPSPTPTPYTNPALNLGQ